MNDMTLGNLYIETRTYDDSDTDPEDLDFEARENSTFQQHIFWAVDKYNDCTKRNRDGIVTYSVNYEKPHNSLVILGCDSLHGKNSYNGSPPFVQLGATGQKLPLNPEAFEKFYRGVAQDITEQVKKKKIKPEDIVSLRFRDQGYEMDDNTRVPWKSQTIPFKNVNGVLEGEAIIERNMLATLQDVAKGKQPAKALLSTVMEKSKADRAGLQDTEFKDMDWRCQRLFTSTLGHGMGDDSFLEVMLKNCENVFGQNPIDEFLGKQKPLEQKTLQYRLRALPSSSKYQKQLIQNYYAHAC